MVYSRLDYTSVSILSQSGARFSKLRKCHQNSYSNRKQPTGISNLGLKIWPEVEIWPFLRSTNPTSPNGNSKR